MLSERSSSLVLIIRCCVRVEVFTHAIARPTGRELTAILPETSGVIIHAGVTTAPQHGHLQRRHPPIFADPDLCQRAQGSPVATPQHSQCGEAPAVRQHRRAGMDQTDR